MGMPVITPSETTRCQAITDIIESVALEQTALSHILNAEGEKIQKIVEIATTESELLEVNKSVESMIYAIVELENVLKAKLELFEIQDCSDCCEDAITAINY